MPAVSTTLVLEHSSFREPLLLSPAHGRTQPRQQPACPQVMLRTHTWGPFAGVQSLSRVRLCKTARAAAHQASLSITNSQSSLKLMSMESVMPSNHLILSSPFSFCLQSFPASGSFQMSEFFTSGSQSIRASVSASVLPMNIQD